MNESLPDDNTGVYKEYSPHLTVARLGFREVGCYAEWNYRLERGLFLKIFFHSSTKSHMHIIYFEPIHPHAFL